MGPQQSIGHYRIVSKLGEGGMGAVYRATDSKLNRDVAIKVLPEAFAQDTARMKRFEREAQVLASLNHPNIAAIYGIEQGAIVMELVEGATPAGPLPAAATVIDFARQIAAGLEAAHEKGIVHRDLKPANLKVTPEGVVKILDFGLAKASEEVASATSVSPTMSPTLSLAMTQAGMILGTAAYMAPEQARGRPIDKRADIWAFGVVLFEMMAGKPPFGTGDTVTDIIAAVVTREPDWNALPADTPAHIHRLLERCLRKDPKLRLRDIGEARIALDERPAAPPIAAAHSRTPWTIAAAALMVGLAVSWFAWRAPRRDQDFFRVSVDLGPGTTSSRLGSWGALSPDGRRIVVAVRGPEGQQLALRPFDQPKASIIHGTEGAFSPFFSPDGQSIGFFADRKLKTIALSGGAAVTLADAANPRGGSWGEDGRIVFAPEVGKGLARIPASGGSAEVLTNPADQNQVYHGWPQVVRRGKSVLFTARRATTTGSDDADLALLDTTSGKWKTIRGGYAGRYLPTGHLVYVQDGALFGVGFDPARGETQGSPMQLLDDVAGNTITAAGNFEFGSNGLFVYTSGKPISNQVQLLSLDRSGNARPLVTAQRQYGEPSFSPDGKWLAVGIGNLLTHEVYLVDLERETLTQLTSSGQRARYPVWTPDSAHLVYATLTANGAGAIWWTRRDGAGTPSKLLESSRPLIPSSFSPDGRRLAYSELGDISILPLENTASGIPQPGMPERFLTSHRDTFPEFSPSGRWLAYQSTEGDLPQIFVRPYPGPGGKSLISVGGGTTPHWSADGRRLYYITGGHIIEVDCEPKSGVLAGGRPRPWPGDVAVFTSRDIYYTISHDGQRAVIVHSPVETPPESTIHVTFLLNFFEEVKRKIP